MIRINNITLSITPELLDEAVEIAKLKKKAASITRTYQEEFLTFKIAKKSLDLRNRSNFKYVYSVDLTAVNEKKIEKTKDVLVTQPYVYRAPKMRVPFEHRPVVVGNGPCGLFAALVLAEAGANPIIIERGKDVVSRKKDIDLFFKDGTLNENSNIQFGEGGAGTYSDGKLTTGIKDKRIGKVTSEFIENGAPIEIGYYSKPHMGTENLMNIVINMRKKIVALGGEYRFSTKLVDFKATDGNVRSVKVEADGKQYDIETNHVVLAMGQAAFDTISMLSANGLEMVQKPFSIGVRIEHLQETIDAAQYGTSAAAKMLGAADYKLNEHLANGRSVYTFCMCPGGEVVGGANEKNTVLTNGMSYYKRNNKNANSAILVSVETSDFGSSNPLAGFELRRKIEQQAFKIGGSNYFAPAQKVSDFLNDVSTTSFEDVQPTYLPGVKPTSINDVFKGYEFITEGIKEGLKLFDKKVKGFASGSAVLTAVETRSSSPVRITRNSQNYQSNIKGIFPCGEGAGYSGGIVSAAVDGISVAEAVILNNQN